MTEYMDRLPESVTNRDLGDEHDEEAQHDDESAEQYRERIGVQ